MPLYAGFLCPKCDNYVYLHTRQDQNELKKAQLSVAKTHWMVNWLQDLNQLDFIWRPTICLYVKFVSMMSPKCSIAEDDGELMLIALHEHFLPQHQHSRVYTLFLA